jgi:hypothetical protein
MIEKITSVLKAIMWTTKTKAILAVLTVLVMCSGIYAIESVKDPYTLDIQDRANLVQNVVTNVLDARSKEPSWKFQTTLESVDTIIGLKRMGAQQEWIKLTRIKLTPEHRRLNERYQNYLIAANNVVIGLHVGKLANLTAMKSARAAMGV